MQITALELANWLEGTLEGNGDALLDRPARIDHAEEAGDGAICFLANPQYQQFLESTNASVVILSTDLEVELTRTDGPTLLRVKDPYTAFSKVLARFEADRKNIELTGIDPTASVHPDAEVDETAWIGANAVIAANAIVKAGVKIYPLAYIGVYAEIGENSVIHPSVTVYDHSKIGKSCIVHAGSAIGSDGFGFAPQPDGSFAKIPQTGNVILEDGVEVGANAAIDRATIGSTLIKAGAKIDNLVQIAHNVEIGSFTVLAAQSGVSGSTKLGMGCMVGGQAGFIGHLKIADGTKVNAQSGVNRSVPKPGSSVTGSPAGDYVKELRNQVVYRKLPDLEKRISTLEAQLKAIKALSADERSEDV
ncbi:MAG: UDP-3-O-[3-hydroxymyristoyl] glucosamine N-acyltransferase [Limisphaerales bacterium]|jgi:UDP-3-O-[3-hydroxymyristoyl] glucosamine N-acyltransferase